MHTNQSTLPPASFPVMPMKEVARLVKRNFNRTKHGGIPQSVILLGSPGTGKTYVFTARQCLPTWYADYLTDSTGTLVTPDDICVMVIRVAEKDGQELAGPGCPFEDEEGNFFFRFSRAPTLTDMAEARKPDGNPYRYFVLVLDEISSSTADTQKVIANMLHSTDRTLGGDKLPLGCWVGGTGNMPADGAGANRLLAHLVDRPKIVRVEFEINGWIDDFAVPNDICPIVIEFMRQHWSDVIVGTPPVDYGNYCTGRSMTEASYDVAALIAEKDFNGTVPSWAEADFASNIGCKAARLLSDFIEQAGEVANPQDVFANPDQATVSDNIGFQYITASMALGAVTSMSEATAALTYVMRLRTDLIVSLGVKLHDMLARPEFTDAIITSPVWMKFQQKYGEYLKD